MSVRYLSCGDTAFSVEFGNEISPQINGQVMALHAAIGKAKADGALGGLVETVPSMRALMVCYDPLATTRAELQPQIDGLKSDSDILKAFERLVSPHVGHWPPSQVGSWCRSCP